MCLVLSRYLGKIRFTSSQMAYMARPYFSTVYIKGFLRLPTRYLKKGYKMVVKTMLLEEIEHMTSALNKQVKHARPQLDPSIQYCQTNYQ